VEFCFWLFCENFKKKRIYDIYFQAKTFVTFAIKKLKKPKEKKNIGPMRSIMYLEGRHMHHMDASSLGLMVTLQVVVAFNVSH